MHEKKKNSLETFIEFLIILLILPNVLLME